MRRYWRNFGRKSLALRLSALAPAPPPTATSRQRNCRGKIAAVDDNSDVTIPLPRPSDDTAELRKARGAYFTPTEIAQFIVEWAVRSPADRVLEPSVGDAAFLVAATRRLRQLDSTAGWFPRVYGVEIHPTTAQAGRARVQQAGGTPCITVNNFFAVQPNLLYSAVIGNPPYIRYQDFCGELRSQSRAAALRAGVALSGLASSWAAFVVHGARFLEKGGRMGLVLPAEFLTVNYAAAVREFLFQRFRTIDLVLFDEQVFPDAQTDIIVLLAEGFDQGPSPHVTIRRARNAKSLACALPGRRWTPIDPAAKWMASVIPEEVGEILQILTTANHFVKLSQWGETKLGMVTGNNNYFALSHQRVTDLQLDSAAVIRLSPPGSAHLRGLTLSHDLYEVLKNNGKSVYLFRPPAELSPAAARYVEIGQQAGIDQAYKCRVRRPWYRVPIRDPADLLLTYMNADTPRLIANEAKTHHLNSVHGVYLNDEVRSVGKKLLPLAALNSVTLLHAEIAGRSYGGGILKLEPREADGWLVPSCALLTMRANELGAIHQKVSGQLARGELMDAVALVDKALGIEAFLGSKPALHAVRNARDVLASRRLARSRTRLA